MLSDEESNAHLDKQRNVSRIDWEALRARSLGPGGFGDDRINLWPQLLFVSKEKASKRVTLPLDESQVDEPTLPAPHQDERQIGLDTDRSFVLYPADPRHDREALQAGLHELLLSLFRSRPRLSYFQGYHDIVTVLYLTLPQEMQLACVEKMSLHRVRDSMGTGLEPVLGLLRVTKNLLQLADPEYARILEQTSPLPFHALSNLLTLFSHDMPTLPLIQHVFDYLLCRPPVAVVYLATAIILSRKSEVLHLEEEGEEGMIHSLLSSLPHLVDESGTSEALNEVDEDTTFFKEGDEFLSTKDEIASASSAFFESHPLEVLASDLGEPAPPSAWVGDDSDKSLPSSVPFLPPNAVEPQMPDNSISSQPTSPLMDSEIPEINVANDMSIPAVSPVKIEENDDPNHIDAEPTAKSDDRKPPRQLTDLLKHADSLYAEFPPFHEGLRLSSILGPQSVVFTWSESPSALPSDNTAEAMVQHPELVVYPYVEPEPDVVDDSSSSEDDKASSGWGIRRRKGKERASSYGTKSMSGKGTKRRRNKLRKSPFSRMEKRTMVAGTVLVLGVALAVYGIKARNGGTAGLFLSFADHNGRHPGGSGGTKDWKRVGGWVGGALVGISEKILNGLSSSDKHAS